jgi:hypothetical protein
MTKATVVFVYFVGTLQTGFALRDFYTLFCIHDPHEDPGFFDKTWNLRSFGFMWITIPLSGASGARVFYTPQIFALTVFGDSGRRFSAILCA